LLTAMVRGRRVRRSVRAQLQLGTSALLYPILDPYSLSIGLLNALLGQTEKYLIQDSIFVNIDNTGELDD